MKKNLLSIAILFALLISSCGETKSNAVQKNAVHDYDYIKVGQLDAKGKPQLDFTISKAEVMANWEKVISNNTKKAISINNIIIKYNDDMEIYNKLINNPALSHISIEEYQIYSIIAESKDGLYKTAYKVEKIANELYVRCDGELLTLTCSGCAIACKPLMIENNNICYTNCSNEDESCTKNETLRISTGKLNIFGTDYKRL